jgi:fructose-bisphosphate aldolase class II
LCHKHAIGVEAELGTIGGAEESVEAKYIIYTDPDKAREFAKKTGIDYLAVAIGTSHGAYKFKGKPELRLDILEKIKQKTEIPLVLHGASQVPSFIVNKAVKYGAKFEDVQGVPDSQIKKAVKLGINKINTDTDLRIAFDAAIRQFLVNKPRDFDPRHILEPARDLMQEVVEHRIKLFGSRNKAR